MAGTCAFPTACDASDFVAQTWDVRLREDNLKHRREEALSLCSKTLETWRFPTWLVVYPCLTMFHPPENLACTCIYQRPSNWPLGIKKGTGFSTRYGGLELRTSSKRGNFPTTSRPHNVRDGSFSGATLLMGCHWFFSVAQRSNLGLDPNPWRWLINWDLGYITRCSNWRPVESSQKRRLLHRAQPKFGAMLGAVSQKLGGYRVVVIFHLSEI